MFSVKITQCCTKILIGKTQHSVFIIIINFLRNPKKKYI